MPPNESTCDRNRAVRRELWLARCVGGTGAHRRLHALRPRDGGVADFLARLLDSGAASIMSALHRRRSTRRRTWCPADGCVRCSITAPGCLGTGRCRIDEARREAPEVVGAVSTRRPVKCTAGASPDQSPWLPRSATTVAFAAFSSREAHATPARTQRGSSTTCARGPLSHKPEPSPAATQRLPATASCQVAAAAACAAASPAVSAFRRVDAASRRDCASSSWAATARRAASACRWPRCC